MPTLTQSINITVPNKISAVLHRKAEQRGVSLSKAIIDLIVSAMELEEDSYYAELAAKRERTSTKLIPFDQVVWN